MDLMGRIVLMVTAFSMSLLPMKKAAEAAF